MVECARLLRLAPVVACLVGACVLAAPSSAQGSDDSFVTGAAAAAYEKWTAAMDAILNRANPEAAEKAFAELLEQNPSPLRLALLAERSILRNEGGGGVLLLEQDAEAGSLKESGKKVAELLAIGREQMNEADDGWYFASVGQFPVAAANFNALLRSNPDPVALLEFSDRVQRRHEILVMLAGDAVMGESVRGVLAVLSRGEQLVRADPVRIKQNIERLAGPSRMYEYSVSRLKDSGEYAVPFLVQALRDSRHQGLIQSVLRALPKLDRAALNPLVMALRVEDRTTQTYVIQSLGQIPYWQSVPYLMAVREDEQAAPEVRGAAERALADLAARGVGFDSGMSAAGAFYLLANAYYTNQKSLMPDPRLALANVWYWRDGLLQNIEVPTAIFDEIMAMRCCEEALRRNPDMKPALSLWLAANFRRESQLPDDMADATRPDNYPSAVYFAQSAGPEHALAALARALDGGETPVALGAIQALHKTGGPSSIVADAAGRQPLSEALTFADRMVRIRAALALGAAKPLQPPSNAQNFSPALAEALGLAAGSTNALVVDPTQETLNAIASTLRGEGYTVITDANLLSGLEKARAQTAGIDLILVASNIESPALRQGIEQLRAESRFGATPVLIVTKPGDRDLVAGLLITDARLAEVPPAVDGAALQTAIHRVAKASGSAAVTPEVGNQLATEAARTLLSLAESGNPLFRPGEIEPALVATLASSDPALRELVATVLGYVPTSTAQNAVARIALSDDEAEPMRVAMFAALAKGAKRNGNHLSADLVERLTKSAESEPNLTLRTAASEALGALNLPSNPASAIIRNQYGG